MSIVSNSQDTCARLLAAAVEVFTEVGYRNATLRAICLRAGANNAAINYHFHDKEHLYLAVIEHAIQTMREHRSCHEPDPSATAVERLRTFVHSMLTDLLGEKPSWLLKLMAWELAEPTAGLDLLVEKAIAPFDAGVASIVRELAGPSATEQEVSDCASSIIAQCHHYHHGRAVVHRLGWYKTYDPAVIEHLTDHITRFSLAGIRALARR